MFSSPAIQIYSFENAESHVQRKPGSQAITRKPLIDRSVNGDTPFNKKLMNKKVSNIETKTNPAQHEIQDTDFDEDFIFSGKDIDDTYDDVWPHPVLGKEGILKIIRNFSYPKNTPPPSPSFDFDEYKPKFLEIDSDFFKLPEFNWEPEKPTLCDEIQVDLPDIEQFDDSNSSLNCSI